MEALALLEAIFAKGAVFFDTSGKGYLSPTGTLFIPMTGGVSEAVRDFIDVWSRGKQNRKELLANPRQTVERLAASHGLVGFFVTKRGIGMLSATERIQLNNYQREWLTSRFKISPDTRILWSPHIIGNYEETTADYAVFGSMTKPQHRKREDQLAADRAAQREYSDFEREIEKRSNNLPGLATAGPKRGQLDVTKPDDNFVPKKSDPGIPLFAIKGRTKVHPKAKMYGAR